jgi:hypothetical protein
MAFNDDKESKRNLSETDELDSNQLDQHESIDENLIMKSKPVKKHKCPFCDKRFTQPNSVSRYVSGVHEGEKPFSNSGINKVTMVKYAFLLMSL